MRRCLYNSVCINRIRLEFKEKKTLNLLKQAEGINRIRLEFKVKSMVDVQKQLHEY